MYADPNAEDPTQIFYDKGFLSPEDPDGSWVACFVGEGDATEEDYIKFQAFQGAVGMDDDDWDTIDPLEDEEDDDDVFNGVSWQFDYVVSDLTDIDIDIFDVTDYMAEDDDAAAVQLATVDDDWNLVYLLIAMRTERVGVLADYPTNITIYNFEGE